MYFFDSSAAAAVTTLNVEPGTYRPALARLSSGAAGVHSAVIGSISPEVLLDEVRVEAGRRRHHEQLPGARIERDDRAAVRPERLVRDLLGVEIERRHDVVALHGLAAELVERLVEGPSRGSSSRR